jgi:Fe-S cluster biogenesis protein NfuA
MFIQTEITPDPATLKFLPGRPVMENGTAAFTDANDARRSPLATVLFGVEGITRVFLGSDFITVTKSDDKDWDVMKPRILGTIMEHFLSGNPVITESAAATDAAESGGEDSIGAQIKDLIDTRIRPAATQDGGDVIYRGFKDGVAYLEFHGSASGLMTGIENMLRHYVPEVEAVKDHRDALPKPGLETPEGKLVHRVIEERINPAVAAHGGHVSLVDVRADTVYIRLEGGCQGCGMADVTLKQGIEVEIKQLVPAITTILDVTDHAGGTNPYYQPGKGGISPLA